MATRSRAHCHRAGVTYAATSAQSQAAGHGDELTNGDGPLPRTRRQKRLPGQDHDLLVHVRHDGEGTIDPVHDHRGINLRGRFLFNPNTDTEESATNADTFVDLPDGSSWALTIFTVEEVRRLLARWKESGEVANGIYFWAVDQLIVPEPGVPAMTTAIRELVRSGEIASVGVRCEGLD